MTEQSIPHKPKLSKVQAEVLAKMQPGEWYSAYDLQCSIDTLFALWNKGYAERQGHDQPDAFLMYRTMIEFRRKG